MNASHFVIADDHPLFREALQQTLTASSNNLKVSQAGSLDAVTAIVDTDDSVDMILLDLKMPGVQGFSGLLYLRSQYPDIPVVVISATEEAGTIRRALELGASAFIPKSTSTATLRHAIQMVMDGEIWAPDDIELGDRDDSSNDILDRLRRLTPQQMRVLMRLRKGLLNKQIAYELAVSEATVKAHVSAILQKLNVESRTRAVIVANQADQV